MEALSTLALGLIGLMAILAALGMILHSVLSIIVVILHWMYGPESSWGWKDHWFMYITGYLLISAICLSIIYGLGRLVTQLF